MMILMTAALAAAQPAVPAPTAPMARHEMHSGQDAGHEGMDCCKDCCKDMAAKHDGHGSEHSDHSNR